MTQPDFDVIFASTEAHLRAVQALRYDVFVRELGGDGALVDHEQCLERDRFDPYSRHLLLIDRTRTGEEGGKVVGAYRLLDQDGAAQAGGFYSEHEYDLSCLLKSKRRLLELGRSCLHREYRGGTAMYHLWSALAEHIMREGIDILFGVASFHGSDPADWAQPLSLLFQRHLAPEALRVTAKPPNAPLDMIEPEQLDRKAAMIQIPALIKAYLRLGGVVGQGAYLDYKFNTTDVCLILDVAQMSEKQRKLYTKGRAR
ncbi:MAG: GNAT family N-acyltransferase [Planktotalea sp.]|uniref:GNAT family N-acetyltransferase n=1 Tax=Planktotalea sp. TaxID=2029877 RepID=UPI003C73B8ED